MYKSWLTQCLVLRWVGGPGADEAGLTEQLRQGTELILTRGQIRIVQGTQNSHLPELWNKNQAEQISLPIRKHSLER
jgi:hypothetical protein